MIIAATIAATTIAATTIAAVAEIGSHAMSSSAAIQEEMFRRAGNAACQKRVESSNKRYARMMREAGRYLDHKIVPVVESKGLYFFEQEEICKLTGEQRARSFVVRKDDQHKRDDLVWDVVQRGLLYYILSAAQLANYSVDFYWREDAAGDSWFTGLLICAPREPQSNSGR